MVRGPVRRLLTLALSLCLVAAGGAAFLYEIRPFSLSGVTPEERLAVLSDAVSASGLSSDGRRDIMLSCLAFSDSLYMRAQPSARRLPLLSGCDTAATQFVSGMPTFSEAWLMKAKIAAEERNLAALPAAIASSRLSAPNVVWLAGERLRLRERVRNLSDDGAYREMLDAGQREDMLALMANNEGIRLLAQQYVTQPDFRERLTSVAETAPGDQQQLLLAHIRASSQK